MAITMKIVLRKKQKADSTYPLAIRITKDRKTSFIHLGQSIYEKDWDSNSQRVRKSHPNSTRLNNFLIAKLAEANEKILELETQRKETSSKTIKKTIQPKSGVTFFTQAQAYIENLKTQKKYNRIVSEEPRLKHFKEFLKTEDITFQEITIPLLRRFSAYLKGIRGVSERTVVNHLILIRTIYNQVIKEHIIDQKHYPFGKDGIAIKFPQSLKIGLNPSEVKSIENLDLSSDPFQNHARNVWLLSYYFAGMRVSDVLRLKWTDFQNERLHYSMGKNAKTGSLKIPEKAANILLQYKTYNHKDKLVFPDLEVVDDLNNLYEVQRKTSYAVKQINKGLKAVADKAKINKKLTMHIARHTFGNISGDRIPIQMLQKLYRHSSVTTTIAYQSNFIHKDVDEALDSVING